MRFANPVEFVVREAVESSLDRCDALSVPMTLPSDEACSFCDYLNERRPYTILYRDGVAATLVTWEQRGQGHVLVIPVAHRVTVLDLTAEERSAVMDGVVAATAAIVGAYDPEGVAVWQNNGIAASQTVPHVHFHVAGTLPGGRTIWGEVDRLPIEKTNEIAARLLPHLSASTD